MIIYSRCFRITLRYGGKLMSYERVTQLQSRIIIGTKQTLKAMQNKEVSEVFIAADADQEITDQVLELAKQLNVPYTIVDSKRKLGKACQIDVGASTVAVQLK